MGQQRNFPHVFYVENIKISVYVESPQNFKFFSESVGFLDFPRFFYLLEYLRVSQVFLSFHGSLCFPNSFLGFPESSTNSMYLRARLS